MVEKYEKNHERMTKNIPCEFVFARIFDWITKRMNISVAKSVIYKYHRCVAKWDKVTNKWNQ